MLFGNYPWEHADSSDHAFARYELDGVLPGGGDGSRTDAEHPLPEALNTMFGLLLSIEPELRGTAGAAAVFFDEMWTSAVR